MSCRLPGARDIDSLWRLLDGADTAVKSVSPKGLPDRSQHPGDAHRFHGAVIDDIDLAGEVQPFGVVDVGGGHRLEPARNIAVVQKRQHCGFGDPVLRGQPRRRGSVAIRLNQFFHRCGRQSTLDSAGSPGAVCCCPLAPAARPRRLSGVDFRVGGLEFLQVSTFGITPS
ncbi:hypothetical protein IRT45_14125 [Nocardia sp. BSTN01]|uniref:hypothetical protein n=1 Tax=Nocardia sp. BSTN01 TaxID=2783665 RepID=UPI00188EB4CE|nr:hypothetical protein [Nocardia sp. BSTN01]